VLKLPKPAVSEHDQEFSFFKMTLLAQQMKHKDFIVVKGIDAQGLFKVAKFENKLGFHEYYEFIKEQIARFYLLKKNADPVRFLGREKEIDD
jgi:hypothetical protein